MSNDPRARLLRFAPRGEEVSFHSDGTIARPADVAARPSPQQVRAAEQLIEDAQGRAETLVQESAERAAVVQQDAYQAGHARGYADGTAEARAELVDALAVVQAAGRDVREMRSQLLAAVEGEAVELVLAAVESILGDLARVDQQVVVDTIGRALVRAGGQNVLRIRVNPEQQEFVQAELAERIGDVSAQWEIAADGSIGVGGCVIDTAKGEIDARLDVQLDEIAAAFRALVRDPSAGDGAVSGH